MRVIIETRYFLFKIVFFRIQVIYLLFSSFFLCIRLICNKTAKCYQTSGVHTAQPHFVNGRGHKDHDPNLIVIY